MSTIDIKTMSRREAIVKLLAAKKKIKSLEREVVSLRYEMTALQEKYLRQSGFKKPEEEK
jgi:hypothetical protein